jgi:hypothetical protein
MGDALNPCPFCGATNMITEPYGLESYVRCQGCGANGPTSSYSECQSLWNRAASRVNRVATPSGDEGCHKRRKATYRYLPLEPPSSKGEPKNEPKGTHREGEVEK